MQLLFRLCLLALHVTVAPSFSFQKWNKEVLELNYEGKEPFSAQMLSVMSVAELRRYAAVHLNHNYLYEARSGKR